MIREVPKCFEFRCDAAGCSSVESYSGHPHESTPLGWMTVTLKIASDGKGSMFKRVERLLCPTHRAVLLTAISSRVPANWEAEGWSGEDE